MLAILGDSDAGISAGLRAPELDPVLTATLILAAGATAVGHPAELAGSLAAQVVRAFDLIAASRTGLRDEQAVDASYRLPMLSSRGDDRKACYPGAG